ncbi:YkvI family membrane protein [Paenibacillus sp. SAF-054]|uniref:YkvI family membrane protein n=1 Tax=unclassified Paenibacillus TaxID=185978 RepID=UPI003F7CE3B5
MKNGVRIFQIAFTYIGTIVGAGFATGQEIIQFFTQYGKWGALTIMAATALFIWLGTKMMLMSRRISARSYEDLNKHLFGPKAGAVISIVMLLILIGVNSVMLAGAGSVFMEHLNLHYQTGLLLTVIGTYLLLKRGMNAILHINSIVVPIMLTLSAVIVLNTLKLPTADRFLSLPTEHNMVAVWLSPLIYTSFNLVMAQAVLVPLGSKTESAKAVKWGGIAGGVGVGLMLLSAHIAISAHMPGIRQYEIPMGSIANHLGAAIQIIYVVLIFMEIFSTFVADIYGITLQLQQHLPLSPKLISVGVMFICFLLSQFGFSSLLSVLYPLFGCLAIIWSVKLMLKSE